MHRLTARLVPRLLVLWAALHAPTDALQAQRLGDAFVQAGDRVRVTAAPDSGPARNSRVTGVLERTASDRLMVRLADSSLVTVALPRVRRLEVSDGRRPLTKQGMGLGLTIGGVGGAVAGLSTEPNEYFSRPVYAVAGAVAFGLAGSVVGGVLGSVVRGERWSEVRAEFPLRRVQLVPQLVNSAHGLRIVVTF